MKLLIMITAFLGSVGLNNPGLSERPHKFLKRELIDLNGILQAGMISRDNVTKSEANGAVLQGLDKVTARILEFSVPANKTITSEHYELL